MTELGIPIRCERPGPHGCHHDEYEAVLQQCGLFDKWCEWSRGITVSVNGVYPWDLEFFLAANLGIGSVLV
jgi:hypothetical protein